MSTHAPWLALAIDWQDSEMFDGAGEGVRLAWVNLLCFVKAQGRAGKARLRERPFANQYRLTDGAVNEMLQRATRGGAIEFQDGIVVVHNWKKYQDPKARYEKDLTSIGSSFSKTSENDATRQGQGPRTNHRNQPPKTSKNPTSAQGAAPLDRGSTDLDGSGSESGFDVSIVTGQTLRSLDRLRAWYRHDLTRPDSIVEGSEEFWQNLQTAAAKAITAPSVRDEIAVFKWLVKGRRWEYLNATYEEIAKAMKSKQRPPRVAESFAANVLQRMIPDEAPPPRNVETIRKLAEGAR